MKKMFVLLVSCVIQATTHQLPVSLQGKAITYYLSKQLDGFSCGYNCLHNACRIETQSGKENRHSNFYDFKTVVVPYVAAQGLTTKQASTNTILQELAPRLHLKHFQYLIKDEKSVIKPLISEKLYITYVVGTPESKIKQLFALAEQKRARKRMEELKSALDATPRGHVCCLHFVCHVIARTEKHGILISVVKDKLGKTALHIFDNMNEPITQSSEIKAYAEWLYSYFELGKKPAHRKARCVQDLDPESRTALFYYLAHTR